nr:MotE family protein [Methylobacterium sp. WL69]
MSSTKPPRIAGEAARMVVPGRAPAVSSRWLALMAARMLAVLGLLAVVSLGLGPVRAQGGKSESGRSEGGKPAVSGLNPGPLPKAAAAKPKLADAKPVEPTPEVRPVAESSKPPEVAQVAEVKAAEAPPEPAKPAAKPSAYCASIADAAADARFAWQKEQLATLERQVDERIRRLEEKRAEYETWLARRNEFLAKADTGVVAIYQKMRPDAAALQLANMPDEGAAAILTKLNARTASAILSEMEAARAAQLARMMTDAGKKARESEKS